MKMIAFLMILVPALCLSNDSMEKDHQIILELIDMVKVSRATFIRNGTKHTALEASEHLMHKYNYARKRFFFLGPAKRITPQEFIDKIASHSSTTGKPYLIKLKGSDAKPIRPWFYRHLTRLQKSP